MSDYNATGEYIKCPICQGNDGEHCHLVSISGDAVCYDCYVCGCFRIPREVREDYFVGAVFDLTKNQRADLSHRLKTYSDMHGFNPSQSPLIDSDQIEQLKKTGGKLLSQGQQLNNLIRIIGDYSSRTGDVLLPDGATRVRVGCLSTEQLHRLLNRAAQSEILSKELTTSRTNSRGSTIAGTPFDLTLDGWERFESLKSGMSPGNFGFMAMQYGIEELEDFVLDVVKPSVKDGTGYDLVDLRDVARAGIIDNLMRQQIRDAAFVVVDLTHDNYGAYWEAGYAEGLGKPVIYICEREKFDKSKTHFDTNHCTTVLWSADASDEFGKELVATIRRSLNLF